MWECKCIGLLAHEHSKPFIELLRSMCYKYFLFENQHEVRDTHSRNVQPFLWGKEAGMYCCCLLLTASIIVDVLYLYIICYLQALLRAPN